MKLLKNMFKKTPKDKRSKHEVFLCEEFEKGRILQIDNGRDNREHFTGKS